MSLTSRLKACVPLSILGVSPILFSGCHVYCDAVDSITWSPGVKQVAAGAVLSGAGQVAAAQGRTNQAIGYGVGSAIMSSQGAYEQQKSIAEVGRNNINIDVGTQNPRAMRRATTVEYSPAQTSNFFVFVGTGWRDLDGDNCFERDEVENLNLPVYSVNGRILLGASNNSSEPVPVKLVYTNISTFSKGGPDYKILRPNSTTYYTWPAEVLGVGVFKLELFTDGSTPVERRFFEVVR